MKKNFLSEHSNTLRVLVYASISLLCYVLITILIKIYKSDDALRLAYNAMLFSYIAGFFSIFIYNCLKINNGISGFETTIGMKSCTIFIIISVVFPILAFLILICLRWGLNRSSSEIKFQRRYAVLFALVLPLGIFLVYLYPNNPHLFLSLASILAVLVLLMTDQRTLWLPNGYQKLKCVFDVLQRSSYEIFLSLIPILFLALANEMELNDKALVTLAMSIMGISGMIVFALEGQMIKNRGAFESGYIFLILFGMFATFLLLLITYPNGEYFTKFLVTINSGVLIIFSIPSARFRLRVHPNKILKGTLIFLIMFILFWFLIEKVINEDAETFLLMHLIWCITLSLSVWFYSLFANISTANNHGEINSE